MPLESQFGEIATRLRKLFDIRGRMATRVDELVVPTVSVGEVNLPPYRSTPRAFMGYTTAAATAAEASIIGIGMPAARGAGRIIVRQIWSSSSPTAAAHNQQLGLMTYAALNATAAIVAGYMLDVEDQDNLVILASGVGKIVPVDLLSGTDPAIFTGPILGRQVLNTAQQLTWLTPATPIVLPAGVALYVQSRTVNLDLQVGWYGEFYANVGPPPTQ